MQIEITANTEIDRNINNEASSRSIGFESHGVHVTFAPNESSVCVGLSVYEKQALTLRVKVKLRPGLNTLRANESIFNLSVRKPRSSCSVTLRSYNSLPNTCVSCEYDSRTCG